MRPDPIQRKQRMPQIEGVLASAARDALKIYWDVDAPATLADLAAGTCETLRRALPAFDLVLTYGGGPQVVREFLAFAINRKAPIAICAFTSM
jgi:spore maturation protein CgeB